MLDIDRHGEASSGFPAFHRLKRAGLTGGAGHGPRHRAAALTCTSPAVTRATATCRAPDFRSTGGYVVAPPSRVGGRPYQVVSHRDASGGLDWDKVTGLLEPERHAAGRPATVQRADVSRLAAWVAALARMATTATTACFGPPAAPPKPATKPRSPSMAAAARSTGLSDREIAATIASARRTAGRAGEHHAGREAAS